MIRNFPAEKIMYDQNTISKAIHTKWAGKTVHFAKETDSTNNWVKNLSRQGAPHGTLAAAEFQSAGKGRMGRVWKAPEGSSVMMSLLLRPDFAPQYASMLTLVMGLSVAQAVEDLDIRTSIKWPNDVVVSRKKICGILTEMSAEMDCIHYVVVGIGINVGQKEFAGEISKTATSVLIEKGSLVPRSLIVAAVMESFEKYYSLYEKAGDLSLIMDEYNSILANNGKEVRVLASSGDYTGISLGIEKDGELLVKTEDGKVQKVLSGEVSVRGIYGYV